MKHSATKAEQKRAGQPAAWSGAELRRLKRILRALDAEPCQCPLRPVPGTLARTWNDLRYRVEQASQPGKAGRRDDGEDARPGREECPDALMQFRAVLLATEACFCATCHDHPIPLETWLWLMEQADPAGMKGPPMPASGAAIRLDAEDGEAEARRKRVDLYEARASAGQSLFHPCDVFEAEDWHAPDAAELLARRKRHKLAAFCDRLMGEGKAEGAAEEAA